MASAVGDGNQVPLLGADVSASDEAAHSASLTLRPKEPPLSADEYLEAEIPSVENSISTVESVDEGRLDLKMENLPSYDDAVESDGPVPLANPRGSAPVQPREDEGRETLPDYSCSIMVQAVFHRKMEFESAVHKSRDRNWYKVFVELQGTALRIHKCKNVGLFQTRPAVDKTKPNAPLWVKAGELVRSYTLQHGDVGVAADYQKRRYVIRLRVETDQFLLSCLELPTFVSWLEHLSAAIDVSPPLDQRTIPREYALPRRRRRAQESQQVRINDDDLIMQQREIMRSQFPHLAQDSESSPEGLSPRQLFIRNRALSEPSISAGAAVERRPSSARAPLRRTTSATSSSNSLTPSQSPTTTLLEPDLHPSISAETGKWSPEQTWTPQYDLLYAKRCMAVLLRKSPRKTNFLILRDKEWLIDWDSGRLQRCAPPEYGETSLPQSMWSNCALARGGVIVRAA